MKLELKDIINKYAELVYTIASFSLRNMSDIDDVIQDVYLKVSDNIYKIKDEKHLRCWLIVTTRNTAYNYNLRFWRRKEEELDETSAVSKDFKDEIIMIKDDINHLSDTYKETFIMYARGYKYEEISKKLKISKEAARKRVERAKEIIKVDIFEEGEL